MMDTRDERIVSPFQAWLVREIMVNSSSSVNILTERDQVMPPQLGVSLVAFRELYAGRGQGNGRDRDRVSDWFSLWRLGR